MRYLKILFTLPLLFCCGWGQMSVHTGALPWSASTGGGGITPVGTPTCSIQGGTTVNVSYTPYAAGDVVVAGASGLYGYAGTVTVTDNKSGSYSQLVAPGYYNAGIFGTLSVASGVTQLTFSETSGTGSWDICISEYSHSGTVHFGNASSGNGYWSGTYTSTLAMQDANNYLISVFSDNNFGTQPTPTATVGTLRAYNNANNNGSIWIQDNTSTNAGSLSTSGTTSPSATGWAASVELRSR